MDPDCAGLAGTSGVRIVTRRHLFDLMKNENLPNLEKKLTFLKNQLMVGDEYSEDQYKKFNCSFAHFKSEMKQRWTKAHKTEEVFLKNNHRWLEGTFEIPVPTQNRSSGRPQKSFEESSERSKRRKTKEIRSNIEDGVIVHAAQVELRKSGKRDASYVLKDMTSSPTRATKYRKAYITSKTKKTTRLSSMHALKMFVEADLTRGQYDIVRNTNKKFFPCYNILQEAKKVCFPPPEACTVTSTSAECQLQGLIDVTVRRLSEFLKEVLLTIEEQERETLKIICKWGCDGSQQTQFKQKFDNEDDSDSNIFQSCFVPVRLVSGKDERVLWENPTPSSPRFCRPIRFRFVKETTDVTKEEIAYVTNSINSLTATEVDIDGIKFSVKHRFVMTMVDGKVCNAATGTTSTSRCFICGATSKDFNQLEAKKDVSFEAIEFGLSILHARIRIFESILHLAYKLPVKKYRTRKTEDEKKMEKDKKMEIQNRFRNETGLIVDMPKANFGNTNDGNTSRRFFEDPQLAADITGISYDLIYRLKVILETISSGYMIDVEKYDKYALETARLYIALYPWYPMTPTLHKVLIHGAIIIKHALVPIGQLSEEAAEARNKHFRSYRLDYSRKCSRVACNQDVFNRLLLSSDPLLSCMRTLKKRKLRSFLPETINLLQPPQANSHYSSESEDENISEED